MGLIVGKPELLAALDRVDKDIRAQQEQAWGMIRSLDGLAGDVSLTGQGWTAAKRHASDAVKPQVQQAIATGEAIIADNATFRSCLEQYIEDDHLEEDGLAECVQRIRSNANLLRQAIDLIPGDDDTGLNGLMDRMLWDSQQKANRLEDKIRRLHALEDATKNLYRHIGRPQPVTDTSPDGDTNAVMAKLVNGKISREQLIELFKNRFGMNDADAQQFADFTLAFPAYAKKQQAKADKAKKKKPRDRSKEEQDLILNWGTQKDVPYQYARLIASAVNTYQERKWRVSAGTNLAALNEALKDMHINPDKLKHAVNDVHNQPGSVDFPHAMGSLARLLDDHNMAYRVAGVIKEKKNGRKVYSGWADELATWGGDVASAKGSIEDWHADMDAININRCIKANPGKDPVQIMEDYYRTVKTDRDRARAFCSNYPKDGKGGDPQHGLDWIRKNGMKISTQSIGGKALKNDKTTADQQATLDQFTSMLQQEIGQ